MHLLTCHLHSRSSQHNEHSRTEPCLTVPATGCRAPSKQGCRAPHPDAAMALQDHFLQQQSWPRLAWNGCATAASRSVTGSQATLVLSSRVYYSAMRSEDLEINARGRIYSLTFLPFRSECNLSCPGRFLNMDIYYCLASASAVWSLAVKDPPSISLFPLLGSTVDRRPTCTVWSNALLFYKLRVLLSKLPARYHVQCLQKTVDTSPKCAGC